MGISRITRWVVSAASTAVVAVGLTVIPAGSAAADTAPQEVTTPVTPPTVSVDVLPTWQINGVVWSQVVVGNTVFATGAFSTARPPGVAVGGAGEIAVGNFIAYDITTGERIAKYDHTFNAQGMVVSASPDGSRVYVGGEFTQVDNKWIKRIAAIDVATGNLITKFAPQVNGRIRAIAATNTTVYAGGNITSVGSTTRTKFAAFNAADGALLPWAPTADNEVWSMVLTPDGSKVVAGGQFPNANGAVANGMAAFDPVSGTRVTWLANNTIKDATNGAITSLKTDGTYIYGSGYSYGTGATFEGPFSLNPSDGSIRWLNDCQGDTYDVQPIGPVTYLVGHAHNCLMINEFPDTSPRVRWQRAIAVPSYPTTVNKGPDMYGWNYAGLPAAGLLHWFPDLTAGTVTGQAQAAWSVSGNSQYTVVGGEFPKINGVAQQGLGRFAMPTVAPKKRAPQWDTNPARTIPPVIASGSIPGVIRISFPSAWDQDNKTLTYKVIRDQDLPSRATVAEFTSPSNFWTLPMLGATDSNPPPGPHTYSVKITDPDGNATWSTTSNPATLTAGSAPYAMALLADSPVHYWRMNDSGSTLADALGDWHGIYADGTTKGQAGALLSETDTAAAFNGTSTGYAVTATSVPTLAPATFSVEAWFKTSSTAGGKIVGWGNATNASSTSYDRHIYINGSGQLTFGVYAGATKTLTSGTGYNDGQWHHVVGAVDQAAGMTFYVDGRRIGALNGAIKAEQKTGYWHIGGDTLGTWPNAPSNRYLDGTIDEVAVYQTALTPAQVAAHYTASGRTVPNPTDPAYSYGQAVTASNPTIYWRLDEATGRMVIDTTANGNYGTYSSGGVTYNQPGAVAGSNGVTLNGTSGWLGGQTAFVNPTVYTEEIWFKSTSIKGGRLMGFGNAATGTSTSNDRVLFLTNTGKIVFGTYTGVENRITTDASYNNGAWHHVVATQGAAGMQLYVDGILVGTNPQTAAQNFTGYWRVGYDVPWSGATSGYLAGSVDEAAVYLRELPASEIRAHYVAGGGVLPNILPTAAAAATAVGLDVTVTADGSTDEDGTIASIVWDFGDGTTGVTGSPATHRYAADGAYQVTVTVTDNAGGTATKTIPVTVTNTLPTAALNTTVASRLVTATGTGTDTDGTIESYSWDFGDGTAAVTGPTATHTYAADGTYLVTLTVTDNAGGTATATGPVTVTNGAPTAALVLTTTAARSVAADGSGSSDPDGTIASYSWDFGDGTPAASGVTATHTYAVDGTYVVTLTVTDNVGTVGTATGQVVIANQAPTAALVLTKTAARSVAADGSGSSDPDGTIASYSWDFGDGTPAQTGVTAVHTYATDGQYTVTLTVTDDLGATASTTGLADASNQLPAATFTANTQQTSLSVDASASFDADGTIASYSWDFGDGTPAQTGVTATHVYAVAGSYTVTLTVTDDLGAVSTASQVIATDNKAPVAAFTATGSPQHVAVDASASHDEDGTVTAYSWDFGDGTASVSGVTAAHDYAAAGTYQVTLTVTDDLGATATSTQAVTVESINQLPTADFTVSGGELVMGYDGSSSSDPDGSIVGYAWTFGDGTTGTGPVVSKTYTAPGNYQVTLTVTDNRGGIATKTSTVWVTGTFARDAFDRTLASGWGTATQGGAWTVASSATPFSVTPNLGAMKITAGQTASAVLSGVTATDADLSVKFSLDKLGGGSGTQVTVIGRGDKSNGYRGKLVVSSTGAMTLSVLKVVAGTETTLISKAVTGVTYVPGDTYNLRVQVWGSGTTSLRAKVWKVGTTEPTTWLASATDTTAAFQVPASIGLLSYLSASATNAPVTVKYSEFAARLTGN
ncbi:MAG: PKD domain-containing protein [Actinomycetales bacterium]|nr:PKD domain-containing protein [Actinomycetales bacterium]